MRHGWFKIPGIQTGDRSMEEQSFAVRPAMQSCAGKTVLDVGCAEGLIAHEFMRCGAREVEGWELLENHLAVAREYFSHPIITYRQVDLNKASRRNPERQFDIVLALSVVHKLYDVEAGLRFVARLSSDLLLLRSGLRGKGGYIYSKHSGTRAHTQSILDAEGFVHEKKVAGHPTWKEDIDYWRRK